VVKRFVPKYENLSTVALLGRGAFGVVKLVTALDNKKVPVLYALKVCVSPLYHSVAHYLHSCNIR
jgi:hypothetical protein